MLRGNSAPRHASIREKSSLRQAESKAGSRVGSRKNLSFKWLPL